MKVILEKIKHFLCYGTPNMTSRWLLWSPIIKELYLTHYSPLKKHKMCTKSPIQGPQLETSGCWFCYLGGVRPSWIYPKWGFKVLQNLNPVILSQFCPHRYIHPNWIWEFKSRQPHLGDMSASTSDCTHAMSCKWPESGHWAICNYTNGKQTHLLKILIMKMKLLAL